jgi:hypothetical protein
MKRGRLQAKDLPEDELVAALRRVRQPWGTSTFYDLQDALPAYPPKVLLAKLAALVRRGVLDGCACGCRGDFQEVARPKGDVVSESE